MAAADDESDAEDGPLTPLGAFMQRRNAELGLSVATVAQRVGMSRASWYRIARGDSASPDLRLLRGLARVYRVRAAEVFALAANAEPRAPTPGMAREAGDALWRCRYERHVPPGAWLDVRLELLNLSDMPWLGAEVRSVHDGWLPLDLGDGRPRPPAADGAGPAACRVALAPTYPGEWVQVQITLQAPRAAGNRVLCLALCLGPLLQPIGSGTFLAIETR